MFYLMIFACLDLIFETDLSPRFTMWSIQLWMAQLISHYVCVYLLSMFHVQCIYEFQFIVVKQCCTTICLRHRSNLTLLLLKHFQHCEKTATRRWLSHESRSSAHTSSAARSRGGFQFGFRWWLSDRCPKTEKRQVSVFHCTEFPLYPTDLYQCVLCVSFPVLSKS